MSRPLFTSLLFTLLAVWCSQPALAENWPTWRGPHHNGISAEKNLPTEFGPEKNHLWNISLPGQAGASPIVWEDRIFLTTVNEDKLDLMCVSTDGKVLWTRTVGTGNQTARGDEGNSASPSPVTDGKHVWSFMGNGDLACYDFDGNKIWSANLEDRYGKFDIQFGMSCTPVLDGDSLYFAIMHGDMRTADVGFSKIIRLNKLSGEEIWAVDRPSEGTHENKHSYASPILYDDGTNRFLIVHGNDYTTTHSLEDGSELWRLGDLNDAGNYNRFLRFVASPGWGNGVIVCPTAKDGPIVGVKATAKGDVTHKENAELWRLPKTTDVPTPLVVNDLVYICRQDGSTYCVEALTGESVYPLKRTHSQRHRASPVYADGHIYLTARDGMITVIKAGREFEIVSKNNLDEQISATPAISNGVIYVRSFDRLWAFRQAD